MAAVPAATASAGSPGAAALALLAVATLSPLAAALAGDALSEYLIGAGSKVNGAARRALLLEVLQHLAVIRQMDDIQSYMLGYIFFECRLAFDQGCRQAQEFLWPLAAHHEKGINEGI